MRTSTAEVGEDVGRICDGRVGYEVQRILVQEGRDRAGVQAAMQQHCLRIDVLGCPAHPAAAKSCEDEPRTLYRELVVATTHHKAFSPQDWNCQQKCAHHDIYACLRPNP